MSPCQNYQPPWKKNALNPEPDDDIVYLYFLMQGVYIVGGHIGYENGKGNLFTVPSNEYAEFNMFLDPLAAKEVFTSSVDITLVPLQMQRRVSSFSAILNRMDVTTQTPEAVFSQHLLSRLWRLQQQHYRYHHMVNFLQAYI